MQFPYTEIKISFLEIIILPSSRNPPSFRTYIQQGHLYVECPKIKCGIRTKSLPNQRYTRDSGLDDTFLGIAHGKNSENNLPFIVSIRQYGEHICGGTILDRNWVRKT